MRRRVHIPSTKRVKLSDKSFPSVLCGKSEESQGYRLYGLMAKRIVVSRHAVFEESKC